MCDHKALNINVRENLEVILLDLDSFHIANRTELYKTFCGKPESDITYITGESVEQSEGFYEEYDIYQMCRFTRIKIFQSNFNPNLKRLSTHRKILSYSVPKIISREFSEIMEYMRQYKINTHGKDYPARRMYRDWINLKEKLFLELKNKLIIKYGLLFVNAMFANNNDNNNIILQKMFNEIEMVIIHA